MMDWYKVNFHSSFTLNPVVTFVIVVLFLSLNDQLNSQIPNSGFEEWEQIENFEKPNFWDTNQDTNYLRLVRDTHCVEGKYSLKFIPSNGSAWAICESIVKSEIKFNTPLSPGQSLYFHARLIPNNIHEAVFLAVGIQLYSEGKFIDIINSYYFKSISEFREFEIPFQSEDVDSLIIAFSGGSAGGFNDGCYFQSFGWVDAVSIRPSNTLGIGEVTEYDVSIFPNPTSGLIFISGLPEGNYSYKIFSITGEMILLGRLRESKVEIPNKGFYILSLEQANLVQSRIMKKIIVR